MRSGRRLRGVGGTARGTVKGNFDSQTRVREKEMPNSFRGSGGLSLILQVESLS